MTPGAEGGTEEATAESGEKSMYTAEFNVYSRIEGEAPKKRNFDREAPKKT